MLRAGRIWPSPQNGANAVKYLLKLCAPRGPMRHCLLLGGNRGGTVGGDGPYPKSDIWGAD